jgi:hypothetical protein
VVNLFNEGLLSWDKDLLSTGTLYDEEGVDGTLVYIDQLS